VGIAVSNAIYLLLTGGGRRELGALWFRIKDLKDVFMNMGYAFGLVKREPRFDRYSYIEKFEYWGMWWGTLLMIVTGFCMWFANTFLDLLPKIALDVVALVHFYEAWLAVLTIIIWHLYYMIFDPHTYPMNWSWITGHITDEDFKARHPLEYERVVREREEGRGE
ncbi:MAG TPA: cytochrome b/b6 domain-containing protein, partial [Candidatus Hydrogenedentes bacterium]|nr:cytochrome b/b6 domain-containing protein [Candidatus Hydrogenedentota bacterium]